MKEKNERKGGFLGMFFRYFRSKFVRKYVSRKRNCKSWFWKYKKEKEL